MKTTKKLFALLLVVAMIAMLSVSALAASIVVEEGTSADDGTQSQDVLSGETYNAYKILNYTSNADKTAYSYYLTAAQYDAENEDGLGKLLEGAGFEFKVSADGSQYVLTNADEITDAAAVASYLYTNKAKLAAVAIASASATATADKQTVFSDLATGYWFVTSSLGSLCSLQSYDDQALIVEKNQTLPPPEKTVSDSEAQVGDVLTYTVTLTDVKGTNLAATIVDTMSEGLTYNNDAVVKATIGGTETTLTKDTEYTETTSGTTVVTWVISAAEMTALDAGDTIVVTYTATVNEKASIDGTEQNTAIARYSEQETDGEPVEVTTTNLTINKVDDNKAALKGAQFELYRTDANSNPAADHEIVKLTEMTDAEVQEASGAAPAADTVYYKVDPASDNTTIDMTDASIAVVYGLDKDSTYSVLEIKAPDGYNLLDEEVEVKAGVASIDVVNEAGTVLPSTGGMGTTLFYVIGAVLVLGAGAVLVARRKVEDR